MMKKNKKKALKEASLSDNQQIRVIGAREHNLKNITVSIPKNKLTIITGPSGSGKSSLALNILFAEGKRRYIESLSSYARQFLGIVKKPDFDKIEGLCPAIAIEQKTVGSNPRSTVGTITELYDYLRILFARVGRVHCPECKKPIKAESSEGIAQMLLDTFKDQYITIAAPIAREKKGTFGSELLDLFLKGYYRFLIDGKKYKFSSTDEITHLKLKKTYKHSIDVLLDMVDVVSEEKTRLSESVEKSFQLAKGVCKIIIGDKHYLYSSDKMCVDCVYSIAELEPRSFSFNSPVGACQDCQGLGMKHEWPWQAESKDSWREKYFNFFAEKYAKEVTCRSCLGKRLNKDALAVTFGNKDIYDLCQFSIADLSEFFSTVQLAKQEQQIAGSLLKEIIARLSFLNNVGLSYLSLNRKAKTLSGGEGQRIRLATQISSALSGVLYILDEPSIGLHQRDNDRLIKTLHHLRDQGNTVVVVEHDIDTMQQSDYIIDMGPAAGLHGGQVTAYGTPQELKNNKNSLTGSYLSGKRTIVVPKKYRSWTNKLALSNVSKNNLQNFTVEFPLNILCGVSGVSGSGKSTMIMQELVPAIKQELQSKKRKTNNKKDFSDLTGADQLENMVVIDQTPIGRTPRSNPATYLGIFNDIRALFAKLPESMIRGYAPGRFSFNVKQGRCFECSGDGVIKVEMHFLPEVVLTCKSCDGKRYNKETLEILYKEKSIADILAMNAREAVEFFKNHKKIEKRLQLLCDVGLDYIALGQSSTTLSGGEAQRIKLVNELAKRGSNTLYILDEPTTGLHNSDIEKLLLVLNRLVDKGNSMIVIEHNIDVLKTVDYLIDLGPEGGKHGGKLIACGTPKEVAKNKQSYTGQYLKTVLGL